MDPGTYIRQLLEERKRVILPGFGNLDVKESGMGVPAEGGRLDPPGPAVRFDASYSKDDGLLAGAIAGGEEMDQEEARQRVLELVDAIRFALDKGESYEIPHAGTFYRDEDHRIHFRAGPDLVPEPGQFGLEPMDLLELDEEMEKTAAPAEREESRAERSPGPTEDRAAGQKEKVTELHPPIASSGSSNRWRVVWIIAGALIVVLLVLILVPVEFWRGQEGEERPADRQESVAGQGEEEESVEKPDQSGDRELPEGTQEPGVQEPPQAEGQAGEDEASVGTPDYFIVAGSFRNLRNASDLQDELRARGYPSEVMITENRMYRVSVGAFTDREKAERRLSEVRSQPGMGSCWLLSN